MGSVTPCMELLMLGEMRLSDMTVEGMRLGERLEVLVVSRRELCWLEFPEVEEVEEAGPPPLSGRGLTC